ncbi:formate dehydrogenase accessory protein FdhE [Neisseriaceae bacterium TC5R-5]|nr:formate dehydrogenase accessory protein FdhE [Neisseriaceae bacterium TC5R-5]
MSIRIVPVDEAGSLQAAAGDIPPLLLPNPAEVYLNRAQRLKTLAQDHPMGAYLEFASKIAQVQHELVHSHPITLPELHNYFQDCAEHGLPPLGVQAWPRDHAWQQLLRTLCESLIPSLATTPAMAAKALLSFSAEELEQSASSLLQGDFDKISSEQAPFIWAALSIYFSQLASQLKITAIPEPDDARHLCPVCNSSPVSSVLHIGKEAGLRYLHCSLCESEWHMVRVKCSNCESTRDIAYWSLEQGEGQQAAIRGESCGDCGSYLKILSQEKDLMVEAVADDLATLTLDAQLEQQGFARSAINPFLFPGPKA